MLTTRFSSPHPTLSPPLPSPQVRSILPPSTWRLVSPTVYFTFWRLCLYDIFVPKDRYDAEIKRMRRSIDEIDRFVPPIGGEPDPKANATKRRKERERCTTNRLKLQVEHSRTAGRWGEGRGGGLERGGEERCSTNRLKLQAEQREQEAHCTGVMRALAEGKEGWFSESAVEKPAESMNHLLQHCIFPRCVFSPADAVYCAKFVQLMHSQESPVPYLQPEP